MTDTPAQHTDPVDTAAARDGLKATPKEWEHIPAPPAPPPPPPPVGGPVAPPPVFASCFLGDTPVWMAGDELKRLDRVQVGDRVRAGFGDRINQVIGINLAWVGPRDMWRINGHFLLSEEHPLWVPAKGWCAPVMQTYLDEMGAPMPVVTTRDSDTVETWRYGNGAAHLEGIAHDLAVGDELASGMLGDGKTEVKTLECLADQYPAAVPLYSLVCSGEGIGSRRDLDNGGTGTMVIGELGFVATAWPNPAFPFRDYLPKKALQPA